MMNYKEVPDIILYGGPASGKSTQAELLVKKLKAAHMNMGQLFRDALRQKVSGYLKISKIMQAGELVPEVITSRLVNKYLKQIPKAKRIVFDGYPRRMKQVRIIEPTLKKLKRNAVMIFIDLPTKVAKERIQKRAKIENRVDDTKIQVVNERIKIFKNQSKSILKYYGQRKSLFKIDGNQDIKSIHKDIIKTIANLDEC